jgi:hypothetical protein
LFLPLENSSSFRSAGILLLDAANHAARQSKVPLPSAAVIQARAEDTAPDRAQVRQSSAPVAGKRLLCRLRLAAIVLSIAKTAIAPNKAAVGETAAAVKAGAIATGAGISAS